MSKTRLPALLCALIFAAISVPAVGQLAEETSVPEPTRLQIVATADGAELVRSERLGDIDSADANAAIAVIEVAGPDGERVRGVRITLESATSLDRVYITESLLPLLRGELQQLETTRQYTGKCQAQVRCIHGIARCRPSRAEEQAYCPGRYSTPESEEGLVLSTPRGSFSFPSVNAGDLDILIGEAQRLLE